LVIARDKYLLRFNTTTFGCMVVSVLATSPGSLNKAVAHSFKNRAEVERSEACACFHCFARFTPGEIRLWADSDDHEDEDPGALRDDKARFKGTTVICPFCECDSVIGSASGYLLDDAFLRALYYCWHATRHD
jgi:hypothetical protein